MSGKVRVSTESGAQSTLRAHAASPGGGYMAGAGYGGHHRVEWGRDHVEHDVYRLDGSVSPRTLDSALTDRLTVFDADGESGLGIFEFALSRSPRFTYRPTRAD